MSAIFILVHRCANVYKENIWKFIVLPAQNIQNIQNKIYHYSYRHSKKNILYWFNNSRHRQSVCCEFFFTYVISNEGVGYDAYTGIYTVPQNGVYPLRSLLASFDYWSIAKIVVNGVPKVGIHAAIPSIMLMNCWQHSYSFFTTGRPFLDCTCPWWRSIISLIPHFRDIFGVN